MIVRGDRLEAAEVPRGLKTDPQRDAYCDAMREQAGRAIEMAQGGADYCRVKADERGVTGPVVDTCEDLYVRAAP